MNIKRQLIEYMTYGIGELSLTAIGLNLGKSFNLRY